jgi:lipoyl(octanoyl) transferase
VLILDHPPGITIGRDGSRRHIRLGDEALAAREWPIHWIARGGGVMLHAPGQVACYPILPLDRLGITLGEYLQTLHLAVLDVLKESEVHGELLDVPGVLVNGRRIAHVGAAVRNNVTGYGIVLNVNPDLELFHDVHCDGDANPMTSLQRESTHRVRVSGVRQRLVDAIQTRFGFARVSLFHPPASPLPVPGFHAVPHRTS